MKFNKKKFFCLYFFFILFPLAIFFFWNPKETFAGSCSGYVCGNCPANCFSLCPSTPAVCGNNCITSYYSCTYAYRSCAGGSGHPCCPTYGGWCDYSCQARTQYSNKPSCSDYCSGDIRYYNGRAVCTSSGWSCSYSSSQNCNSYDFCSNVYACRRYDYVCSGGSCTTRSSGCAPEGCPYVVDDSCNSLCNNQDGWYDTRNTRWVTCSDNQCQECEEKEQRYRDYYCSGNCVYNTIAGRWVATGNRRNKPNGTSCFGWPYCSGNVRYYNFACSNGSCVAQSSENCDSYDGCYSGYYRDYYCSGGYCNYNQSCTENCCDAYYGNSNAYCSGGTCYPPPSCSDECSPSGATQYQCSGTIVQRRTCGNYDADSCLEWSSWSNVEDCNNRDGCYSGYYRDYYCSGGSCTYTQRCTENCCDQYYGNPYAYCSVGTCYPPPSYTLSVSKSGDGSGTVTGPGINCGTDCSESYIAGTTVTLTATPASGSYFAGWSGDCSGTGSCTLVINSNKSVTAIFNRLNQPPNVSNPYETQNSCAWGFFPQVAPGLAITLHWTYSDPERDSRSAFEIWLDDSSNFQDPKFNKIFNISSREFSQSYVLNLSDDQEGDWLNRLAWGTTYYWKVRVKDSAGNWSNWSTVDSFITPSHASPYVNFKWSPQNPTVNQVVQFTDLSECYDSSNNIVPCSSWYWTFQNGNPPSSTNQNPTTTFSSVGSNLVTLRVTDSSGYWCENSKTVRSTYPLPFWQEIPPALFKIRDFLANLISKIIFKT